jgi:two-component system chemotaxis response regulator CheB
VIAVVLSGSRDDGAVGAAAVAAHGGVVLVQSPDEALYPSMPRAALARTEQAQIAPAAALGKLIGELAAAPIAEPAEIPDARLDGEVAISDFADLTTDRVDGFAPGFGCPACGGSLAEVTDAGAAPRFRCRVGHAWSPESLLDEQAVATEGALWTALRALEEKAALSRRLAGGWAGRRQGERFAQLAQEADQAGALIRNLLGRLGETSATQEE